MPKKIKLNLKALKVQSFVTAISDDEKLKLKGGDNGTASWSNVPTGCLNQCPTGLCCTGCNSYCSGNSVCTC